MTGDKANGKEPRRCKCPYCDEELKLSCFEPAFCEPCKTIFTVCETCGAVLKEDGKSAHKCPPPDGGRK